MGVKSLHLSDFWCVFGSLLGEVLYYEKLSDLQFKLWLHDRIYQGFEDWQKVTDFGLPTLPIPLATPRIQGGWGGIASRPAVSP